MKQTLIKKKPPLGVSLAAIFVFFTTFFLHQVVSAAQSVDESSRQAVSKAAATQNNAENTIIEDTSQNIVEHDGQSVDHQKSVSENGFDTLSAHSWMTRLSDTIRRTSFELSFVVTSPQRDTMPYVWRRAKLKNGDFGEQLSLLNGPGFEQIRINDKLSIFEPGFAALSIRANAIDGPIPYAFTHRPDLLDAGYDVLLMGRSRVSGRMAQQIRVISKDKSRYQYHLWIDEHSGILLKQNMYDLQGGLLKQIQVTQLLIGEEVQEHFINIQVDQLPPIAVTHAIRNQSLPWTLSFLPVGMQKVTENLRRISLTGQPAEYMMVSDGLVDVSIYVTKATDVSQEDIALTNDATSIVSISDGRIQVTVVGEIPLETASKMANSIVLVGEKP